MNPKVPKAYVHLSWIWIYAPGTSRDPQRRQLLQNFWSATKLWQLLNFLVISSGWNGITIIFSRKVLEDSPSCISQASTHLDGHARSEMPWVLYTVPLPGMFSSSNLEDELRYFPKGQALLLAIKSGEFPNYCFSGMIQNLCMWAPSVPSHVGLRQGKWIQTYWCSCCLLYHE